jgi:hypothetical protein
VIEDTADVAGWLAANLELPAAPAEAAERRAAIGRSFAGILKAINDDDEILGLLLGPVDHLAFVAPDAATPAGIERLQRLAEGVPCQTTVLSYATAVVADLLGKVDPEQPYLLCEWNDDCVLSTAFSHSTLRHVTRSGRPYVLGNVGRRAIAAHIEQSLAPKVEHGHHLRPRMIELSTALLGGTLRLPASVSAGSETLELTAADLEQALEPLTAKVRRFLEAAAARIELPLPRLAVPSGTAWRLAAFARAAGEALSRAGFEYPLTPADAALFGVHACVKAQPALPYDCGVLIRHPGSELGLGTLVLIRPTAVGQRRESGELELPAIRGETLEVAFYLRRIEFQDDKAGLEYQVMKSHTFVPCPDDAGRVRLAVTMEAVAATQVPEGVTVTIELQDLIAGETLRFENLRLSGGQPLSRPPLRDPGEVRGAEWGARIHQILDRLTKEARRGLPIEEWRSILEGRPLGGSVTLPSPSIPRREYARQILELRTLTGPPGSSGCTPCSLMDGDFVDACTPAEFQSAARAFLFCLMHSIAGRWTVQRSPLERWLRTYPLQDIPRDPACAQEWFNALSQTLAGSHEDAAMDEQARGILRFFGFACSAPEVLNVAW